MNSVMITIATTQDEMCELLVIACIIKGIGSVNKLLETEGDRLPFRCNIGVTVFHRWVGCRLAGEFIGDEQ